MWVLGDSYKNCPTDGNYRDLKREMTMDLKRIEEGGGQAVFHGCCTLPLIQEEGMESIRNQNNNKTLAMSRHVNTLGSVLMIRTRIGIGMEKSDKRIKNSNNSAYRKQLPVTKHKTTLTVIHTTMIGITQSNDNGSAMT